MAKALPLCGERLPEVFFRRRGRTAGREHVGRHMPGCAGDDLSVSYEGGCCRSHHECSGHGYRQSRHIGRRERVFRQFGCQDFDHLITQLRALREAGHVTRPCPAFMALTSIGWAGFPAALSRSSHGARGSCPARSDGVSTEPSASFGGCRRLLSDASGRARIFAKW